MWPVLSMCNWNMLVLYVGPFLYHNAVVGAETVIIVRENQDKGVTKRGTMLVFVYKIDKNVPF